MEQTLRGITTRIYTITVVIQTWQIDGKTTFFWIRISDHAPTKAANYNCLQLVVLLRVTNFEAIKARKELDGNSNNEAFEVLITVVY